LFVCEDKEENLFVESIKSETKQKKPCLTHNMRFSFLFWDISYSFIFIYPLAFVCVCLFCFPSLTSCFIWGRFFLPFAPALRVHCACVPSRSPHTRAHTHTDSEWARTISQGYSPCPPSRL
jgi:hypothetical protein